MAEQMIEFLVTNPGVVAAFLSAVAAIGAAVAAWRGPISAAELADRLRRAGDETHERRRLKLYVFHVIMQERAQLFSQQGAGALNLIDAVYYDVPAVREAWAELYLTFDSARGIPDHVQDERLRTLLRAMAIDIGIPDSLRIDDFSRVYFPKALAEEQRVQALERAQALARLQGAAPTANTASSAISIYPPRPT